MNCLEFCDVLMKASGVEKYNHLPRAQRKQFYDFVMHYEQQKALGFPDNVPIPSSWTVNNAPFVVINPCQEQPLPRRSAEFNAKTWEQLEQHLESFGVAIAGFESELEDEDIDEPGAESNIRIW